MKIKPYGKKILVKALEKIKSNEETEKEQETKVKRKEIILLSSDVGEQENYYKAEVLDFGTDIVVEDIGVKKGNIICIVRYTGILVDEDLLDKKDRGYKYYLIEEADMIAIVE